ncbi:MAG: ACT domain-containing protein [Clostridia bacterium]|nr:ACT domain-containing protein [Clostridia bacterium]MBQ7101826.1 ACT domain-containing protein [Clostridia bacterium]MBR3753688.1 ACT domain-containing protein [Clostridia bacterium]
MAIKQLTVYVQNKKGAMASLTDVLAKNNVNIRALSIAETEDFGLLRIIVDNEAAATKILEENGYLIKAIDVVGVKIGDKPGALTAALNVLDKADIDVEYLYAFMARTEKHAYVVLRVENNEKAEAAIEEAGLHLITNADICKL